MTDFSNGLETSNTFPTKESGNSDKIYMWCYVHRETVMLSRPVIFQFTKICLIYDPKYFQP